ncbi:MAG: DUF5723 family protein [candidate division WOR-3 bacterium]
MNYFKLLFLIQILSAMPSDFAPAYFSEFNCPYAISEYQPKFAYRVIGFSAGLFNNSFTVQQYNRYSGTYLDNQAKVDILNSIPHQGFFFHGGANLEGLEIFLSRFSISILGCGFIGLEIPKDIFDLALFGNQLNRYYSAAGFKNRTLAYWSGAIAYNSQIPSTNLAVGVRARYLAGIYYFETFETQGYLFTTPAFLVSEGEANYRRALGGNGFGCDLMLSYDFSPKLRTTLAFLNLNSGIKWTNNPQQGLYYFALDSLNWQRLRQGDFFYSNRTVTETVPFHTRLPFYLLLAADYQLGRSLIGSVLINQSFNESPLMRRAPIFATAIEFHGLAGNSFRIPIAIGISLGGKEKFGFSYRLGWVVKKFSGSLAFKDFGGCLFGAKGTTTIFTFGYNLTPAPKPKLTDLYLRGVPEQ